MFFFMLSIAYLLSALKEGHDNLWWKENLKSQYFLKTGILETSFVVADLGRVGERDKKQGRKKQIMLEIVPRHTTVATW